MTNFRLLAGLPGRGPYPEQFSVSGKGTHSEGLVVRVYPSEMDSWVGNFQRGLSSLDVVHHHPNLLDLVVIAGGQAYVVSAISRELLSEFGGHIEWSVPLRKGKLLLFHDGLYFTAFSAIGELWKSRRLSWDGLRVGVVEYPTLLGSAWDMATQSWTSFELDLHSGKAQGGSYPE